MNTNDNGKGDAPRQGSDSDAYAKTWNKIFGRDKIDLTEYLPCLEQDLGYYAIWDPVEAAMVVEDSTGREIDSWLGVATEDRAIYILQETLTIREEE